MKQYFKLDKALRTETTFNDTYDFQIGRNLGNLPRLRTLGRHINHRLLTLERVAQHCAIASQTVERIVLPTVDDGQRAPALRWGDPRTMALFSALCACTSALAGITNRSLRQRVGALYDAGPKGYTQARMSYDLRRLRLKGLLQRLPRSQRYVLTPLGRRVALFMSKSFARIVRPVLHRLDPSLPDDAPDPLRRAWRACEQGKLVRLGLGCAHPQMCRTRHNPMRLTLLQDTRARRDTSAARTWRNYMSEEDTTLRLVRPDEQRSEPTLAETTTWSAELLAQPAAGDHIVHFYESDEFLVEAVSHFAAGGLAAGEPVVVVATEAHRTFFVERLRRNGASPDIAVQSGQLVLLDAQDTLLRFMVGDEPNWERFRSTLAPVLQECRARRPGARVRVFGEMVDILWRAGNRAAAVRLEDLWNQLARAESFALLCAYAMGNFYMPGDGKVFDSVCGRHSHVIPSPESAGRSPASLEGELKARRELEAALRKNLQDRAVTASKLEERTAHDAERFKLLVESVQDYAIFMLDANGHVNSWNTGAERIKGYRENEIVGQHFSRFYPPEVASRFVWNLKWPQLPADFDCPYSMVV